MRAPAVYAAWKSVLGSVGMPYRPQGLRVTPGFQCTRWPTEVKWTWASGAEPRGTVGEPAAAAVAPLPATEPATCVPCAFSSFGPSSNGAGSVENEPNWLGELTIVTRPLRSAWTVAATPVSRLVSTIPTICPAPVSDAP